MQLPSLSNTRKGKAPVLRTAPRAASTGCMFRRSLFDATQNPSNRSAPLRALTAVSQPIGQPLVASQSHKLQYASVLQFFGPVRRCTVEEASHVSMQQGLLATYSLCCQLAIRCLLCIVCTRRNVVQRLLLKWDPVQGLFLERICHACWAP